jgi:LmbE family N-acetylglucosaminyl deacetylase
MQTATDKSHKDQCHFPMLKLQIPKADQGRLKVLFLGAHSDDIEIGCGGTVLRLIRENPEIGVTWMVFSALGERGNEAKKSAQEFLKDVPQKRVMVHEFKDGYFPYRGAEIKDIFEQLKRDLSPDVIFTHYRNDLHQDHRLLCELTWNTWRDHFILEYEIPKYDGDLGSPNFFVTLDDDLREKKVELLMRFFQTQANKHWFSPETFNAIMRLRGVECKSPGGYAEAYYGRKLSF